MSVSASTPAGARLALPLFSATILLSAFLLFLIQPLFAKMALPLLGGAPVVWNTALVFFQAVLLLGYLYAHALIDRVPARAQAPIHLAVMALAVVALPIAIAEAWRTPPEGTPILWLIGLFAVCVGLPYFAVTANAPLLQGWFARTGHKDAGDPYFLYGASNIGGLAALAAYPFLIEPRLTLAGQSWLWTAGFAILAAGIVFCAVLARGRGAAPNAAATAAAPEIAPSWPMRLYWVALAFVPSALMVAVTNYMVTDLAAIPLLWIAPLSLYLVSFVIAFARQPRLLREFWPIAAIPFLCAAAGYAADTGHGRSYTYSVIALSLAALLFVATAFHGALAERRPPARRLTEFYVFLSLGGILGGAFVSLAAPRLFDRVIEYPIVLIFAALIYPGQLWHGGGAIWRNREGLIGWFAVAAWTAVAAAAMPQGYGDGEKQWARYLVYIGFATIGVAAVLFRRQPLLIAAAASSLVGLTLYMNRLDSTQAQVIYRERTYFGAYKVETRDGGRSHLFLHGSTIHGAQFRDETRRRDRQTYYHEDSGLGRMFLALDKAGRAPRSVGAIGLGTGEISCWRKEGASWTFFEIDPAVARMARNPALFTYVTDCAPDARIVIGDGRLTLARELDGRFDVIVVDAFSSDSIPVHLITREAVALYLRKLAPGGVILIHTSNRFLDLRPVVANLARDAGVHLRYFDSAEPAGANAPRRYGSDWLALMREEGVLQALTGEFDLQSPSKWGAWSTFAAPTGVRVWTDDYSNVVGTVKGVW